MDRGNRNGTRGDIEMIHVVPFLCKKVRLCWGVWLPQRPNQHHKGLTLFSGDPRHKGLGHGSSKGIPQGETGLYKVLGAHIHNLIGGSQMTTKGLNRHKDV